MPEIREATLDDASAVATLITYLGYETTADEMRLRLQSLSASQDYVSLVATEEENVVGFLGLAFSLYYEHRDLCPYRRAVGGSGRSGQGRRRSFGAGCGKNREIEERARLRCQLRRSSRRSPQVL
jgi:hypothetical protein